MICLVAYVTARPGMRSRILEKFHANTPAVRAEEGCIEYAAYVDAADAPSFQAPTGADTFVAVEKWESVEALRKHAATPHMAAYGAATKEWVASKVIHILKPAHE